MSEAVPAKAAPVPTQTAEEPRKLDDVLLAMDVVDTIRHRERIVDVELSAEKREEQLVSRLKEIYDAQGIQVPDRILKDGVKALEEHRFVYKPTQPGFNRNLAHLYVNRKRRLPGLMFVAIAAVIVSGVTGYSIQAGNAEWKRIPGEITRLETEGVRLATDPAVDAQIQSVGREGMRAYQAKERGAAKTAVEELRTMNAQLGAEYDVRIVSRPGEDTGFYRVPDDQPNGRNFFIVVEAVAPGGRLVDVPVRNEETQKTDTVSKWAQRVSEDAFDRISDDKRGDNVIQNDILGHKALGELQAKFEPGVEAGAITEW